MVTADDKISVDARVRGRDGGRLAVADFGDVGLPPPGVEGTVVSLREEGQYRLRARSRVRVSVKS